MGQILCVKKVPFRKSGHIYTCKDILPLEWFIIYLEYSVVSIFYKTIVHVIIRAIVVSLVFIHVQNIITYIRIQ